MRSKQRPADFQPAIDSQPTTLSPLTGLRLTLFDSPMAQAVGCILSRFAGRLKLWCTGEDSNLRTSLGGTDLQSVGFNHSPTCAETFGRCGSGSRRPDKASYTDGLKALPFKTCAHPAEAAQKAVPFRTCPQGRVRKIARTLKPRSIRSSPARSHPCYRQSARGKTRKPRQTHFRNRGKTKARGTRC